MTVATQNISNGNTLSTHSSERRIPGHVSRIKLSFIGQGIFDRPNYQRCNKHTNGTMCSCLRKSKCYAVERKTREVESLMTEEIDNSASKETLPTEDHL